MKFEIHKDFKEFFYCISDEKLREILSELNYSEKEKEKIARIKNRKTNTGNF